ncbi:MAG: hypothetical protein ACFFGZ_02425 [Candidatus Thorarchaeota archaeon]
MSVQKVKQFMQMLQMKAKQDSSLQDFLKKWVGPYDGKILQVETDGEHFYGVVSKDGTFSIHDGEYPSPDVIYRAPSDILLGIFTGKINFMEPIRNWEMVVIGAAHESVPLSEFILQAMMAM